jgi:hypothetical protein
MGLTHVHIDETIKQNSLLSNRDRFMSCYWLIGSSESLKSRWDFDTTGKCMNTRIENAKCFEWSPVIVGELGEQQYDKTRTITYTLNRMSVKRGSRSLSFFIQARWVFESARRALSPLSPIAMWGWSIIRSLFDWYSPHVEQNHRLFSSRSLACEIGTVVVRFLLSLLFANTMDRRGFAPAMGHHSINSCFQCSMSANEY